MTSMCQKQRLAHHVIGTCHQVAHRRYGYDTSHALQTRNGAKKRVRDVLDHVTDHLSEQPKQVHLCAGTQAESVQQRRLARPC